MIHKDNIIEYQNLTYYKLGKDEAFGLTRLMGFDVILMEHRGRLRTQEIIREFRSHYNSEYYLKPIFILGTEETSDFVKRLIDGQIYSVNDLNEVSNKAKEIIIRASQLNFEVPSDYKAQMFTKLLNYMYTRQIKRIAPLMDRYTSFGYSFPEISINFNHDEEYKVLELLNEATSEGLFSKDHIDRVYLCPSCHGGFLNYREVCPSCGSSNSEVEDLVHHFSCAYIGPISDFQSKEYDELVCPKCNKNLRHIGVDYDKPSVIYHCNSCENNFQDFNVKAKCVSCGTESEVEHLLGREIYKYDITNKGEVTAQTGFVSSNTSLNESIGVMSFDSFKQILRLEVEKLKEIDIKSCLGIISIENSLELYQTVGMDRKISLMTEMALMMKEGIDRSNMVSMENDSTFVFLFFNRSVMASNVRIAELQETLENMFKDNFSDLMINLKTNVVLLTGEKDSKEQFIQLKLDMGN